LQALDVEKNIAIWPIKPTAMVPTAAGSGL
jgi:hypothetical protein